MHDFNWRVAIHQALRDYHNLDALQQSHLSQLSLVDSLASNAALSWLADYARGLAVQSLLDRALDLLAEAQPEPVRLLRRRFVQARSINELSKSTSTPISTLNDHQRRALEMLVTVIMRLEVAEQQARRQRMLVASLPAPSYQQLVGFEPYLHELGQALDATGAGLGQPLFITGLGGIGKTSLAREALLTWLQEGHSAVERVAWVAVVQAALWGAEGVRSQRRSYALDQVLSDLGEQLSEPVNALPTNERRLKALTKRLREAPTVVVIDNIETPAEVQVALTLTENLAPVAQIVLTSRRRLELPAGRLLVLSELPETHALALLTLEGKRLGIDGITEALSRRIYQTVGGNPLALKLVVAQLGKLPSDLVLAGFNAVSQTTQQLFDHIYETSWRLLSWSAQQALLGMFVLPASGVTWEGMRMAVAAEEAAPDDAAMERVVEELASLNLIQVGHSSSHPPIYSLHRLTYSFLATHLGLPFADM